MFGKKRRSPEEIHRHNAIKQDLTKRLSIAVKKLQQEHIGSDSAIHSGDTANSICNVLEATFLHGLRASFVNKPVGSANKHYPARDTSMPSPSFWQFLAGFTHKGVVDQLAYQSQINSEIGLCRAWVRLALNDGTIESYMDAMMRETGTLNHFYHSYAFLKDLEQPQIMRDYLQGLGSFVFQLSYNSSVLNIWGKMPLRLAGLLKGRAQEEEFPAPQISAQLLGGPACVEPEPESTAPPSSPLQITPLRHQQQQQQQQRQRQQTLPAEERAKESVGGQGSTDEGSSLGSQQELPSFHESEMSSALFASSYEEKRWRLGEEAGGPNHHHHQAQPPPTQAATAETVRGPSPAQPPLHSHSPAEEVPVHSPAEEVPVHSAAGYTPPQAGDTTGPEGKGHDQGSIFDIYCSSETAVPGPEPSTCDPRPASSLAADPQPPASQPSPEETGYYGNRLGGNRGWSSVFESQAEQPSSPQSSQSKQPDPSLAEKESYGSLLQSYTPRPSIGPPPATMQQVLSQLPDRPQGQQQPPQPLEQQQPLASEFEVVPVNMAITSDKADSKTRALMTLLLKEISGEQGLDSQSYACKGCASPIGIIYGKANVCGYNGCYYCKDCHDDQAETLIPARVIHNWDFSKRKVAKTTKLFLDQVDVEPLINIKKSNPSLYSAIPELNNVKELRMQLTYLKAYLFTCKHSAAEELKKKVWPRDYFLENVHVYSMFDLKQVMSGQLGQYLKKIISFAAKHVKQCKLCSQKGFICELCNSPKIIYPFDFELTVRCGKCKAVFHRACKVREDHPPCPKCDRRKLKQSHTQQVDFPTPWT